MKTLAIIAALMTMTLGFVAVAGTLKNSADMSPGAASEIVEWDSGAIVGTAPYN